LFKHIYKEKKKLLKADIGGNGRIYTPWFGIWYSRRIWKLLRKHLRVARRKTEVGCRNGGVKWVFSRSIYILW